MKKGLVLLSLIIVLGAFLRLYKVADKELWYDEAFSAEVVNNSFPEVFRLSTFDVHPPLYYFVLKLGTTYLGRSELALRMPSVIFGTALIPLVYFLVRYLKFSQNRALLAALLVAANPFLTAYSREARSYSMLAFLTVLAFIFLIKALREKKYLPITLALLLMFLTHYIAVFFIFVCAIILILHNKKTLFYLLPLAVVIALWVPTILASSNSTGLKWVPRFTLVRAPQSMQAFVFGTDTNKSGLHPPLNPLPFNSNTTAIFMFAGFLIFIAFTKPSKEAKLLLICGAAPIMLVAATSMLLNVNLYVERYMTGFAALILVYLVLFLPKPALVLPYIGLCVYLILSFKPTSIGYRELAKYQSIKPLVMTDAGDYITAKYYVQNIKLQDGDWSQWVIIHNSGIVDKQTPGSFYLVNRGPLKDWKPTKIVGEFYMYDWETKL